MVSPITARWTVVRTSARSSSVTACSSLDQPLLDSAGREDQHDEQAVRCERDQLDVTDRGPGEGGVLHDRDLVGQLREQPHRAVHHVVEVDRPVEEGGDRALLGGAHRLERGQAVDEQPVALVGGDPAGAGVRLGDEPLLLQRRHVVADGRGRDTEGVTLDQGLGADRLLGGDVVLDDGSQDGELAVVLQSARLPQHPGLGHVRSWHSSALSAKRTSLDRRDRLQRGGRQSVGRALPLARRQRLGGRRRGRAAGARHPGVGGAGPRGGRRPAPGEQPAGALGRQQPRALGPHLRQRRAPGRGSRADLSRDRRRDPARSTPPRYVRRLRRRTTRAGRRSPRPRSSSPSARSRRRSRSTWATASSSWSTPAAATRAATWSCAFPTPTSCSPATWWSRPTPGTCRPSATTATRWSGR